MDFHVPEFRKPRKKAFGVKKRVPMHGKNSFLSIAFALSVPVTLKGTRQPFDITSKHSSFTDLKALLASSS